jgi:hypothetical protein
MTHALHCVTLTRVLPPNFVSTLHVAYKKETNWLEVDTFCVLAKG